MAPFNFCCCRTRKYLSCCASRGVRCPRQRCRTIYRKRKSECRRDRAQKGPSPVTTGPRNSRTARPGIFPAWRCCGGRERGARCARVRRQRRGLFADSRGCPASTIQICRRPRFDAAGRSGRRSRKRGQGRARHRGGRSGPSGQGRGDAPRCGAPRSERGEAQDSARPAAECEGPRRGR